MVAPSVARRRQLVVFCVETPRCPYPSARRRYFGMLSPTLRQRGGSKELLYQHVRAAYSAILAQVRHLVGAGEERTPESVGICR